MEITRRDRVAVLLLAVTSVTPGLGTAVILFVLTATRFSRETHTLAIALVLLGIFLLQERLILAVLMWRGYLCRSCRSKSITSDVRKVIRGHSCACPAERPTR